MSFLPLWMNDVGAITSVVSLLLTAYVAWNISRVAKHYRELALVPILHSKISIHLRNLDNFRRRKDWLAFQNEVAAVAAMTEGITVLSSELSDRVKDLERTSRDIFSVASGNFSNSLANKLVIKMREIKARLEYHMEDKRWQTTT